MPTAPSADPKLKDASEFENVCGLIEHVSTIIFSERNVWLARNAAVARIVSEPWVIIILFVVTIPAISFERVFKSSRVISVESFLQHS